MVFSYVIENQKCQSLEKIKTIALAFKLNMTKHATTTERVMKGRTGRREEQTIPDCILHGLLSGYLDFQ